MPAASRTKRQKREYVIQTVKNCLRVLEAFHEKDELGVTELAKKLDLHKNNVFRLLATLQEAGYVEKNERTQCYRLGFACLELARAFVRGRTLPALARPILRELARRTGESAHLGVLAEFEVMHLDGEQPERLVLNPSRVAQRLPAHCTALGKVLIGCGDPRLLEAYDEKVMRRGALHSHTDLTLADRDKLLAHLHSVGAQGYALDIEECEAGLCCAAAPVHDASGQVIAALSVSGPAFRLNRARLEEEIVPTVREAASRLSSLLGHDPAAISS